MAGRIALVGGDEFMPTCREMDAELIRATGKSSPRVLVVPTASERNAVLASNHGVTHFLDLGADAAPLMVTNSEQANDEALVSEIDGADIVYFTGGNPAKLLEDVLGSLLISKLEQLLERDAILAGSSAGAMVMGSWMRFREWRETLGIVPGVVALPHHERSTPEETSGELVASGHGDLWGLGIDGATGCLSGSDGWTVLGGGSIMVYKNGDWQRYGGGESFSLR
ncbi:MAG: Type 1 glutamine amidotransferase-like domain-containing protein [Chloroflexi bacterium]|nr:Type 1 glutamine amidotransferase-like domain-containing protein [Chloroflexota bacterium]